MTWDRNSLLIVFIENMLFNVFVYGVDFDIVIFAPYIAALLNTFHVMVYIYFEKEKIHEITR